MSIDEIIQAWKNGLQPGKTPARSLHSAQESEKRFVNPAGEMELSDEELELIEGGGGSSQCSCPGNSCAIRAF